MSFFVIQLQIVVYVLIIRSSLVLFLCHCVHYKNCFVSFRFVAIEDVAYWTIIFSSEMDGIVSTHIHTS